jgi:tetratricopeptide (TPR) repeat protein
LAEHIKLLFRLWFKPVEATGAILDRGSLLAATIAALVVGLALSSASVLRTSFYMPLLVLAVIYVPGLLVIAGVITRSGLSFGRDYAPLLTCIAMAWSASQLPVVVAAWILPFTAAAVMAALSYFYFVALTFLAVRTVFGASNATAAAIVLLSWVPLVVAAFLWAPLQFLFRLAASPFFLFFIIYYLASEVGQLGAGFRRQQSLSRMLQAAAVNPHDGEAQYQLGLIYQHRRQYGEAVRRFEAAVAIDPEETDAQFQLGRIALEQGRLSDALSRFQTVVRQDDKHSLSEIHRELGTVYFLLDRYPDAERELALYTERREYDPEGLYRYGQVVEALGRSAEARDVYQRAIEAARTAPRYRRRIVAPWSRLAQRRVRAL